MVEVMDIETIKGLFTYTGFDVNTKKVTQFIIHESKNEVVELVAHIKFLKGMIGFNSLNFDYPVLHFIARELENSSSANYTNGEWIKIIYDKAQEIIHQQNQGDFTRPVAIPEKYWMNQQLDLFKLWHYNNKARSTSLKSLEISMNLSNVMDMPIDHTQENISEEDIISVLEYNLYDVKATYEFYLKSFEKIELRKSLKKQYSINCMNWSDSRIGEELILKMYCDATNTSPWDIKPLRTRRDSIALKECILPYVKFRTPEFSKLLDTFKSKTITTTKGAIEESVIYKGFKYDYGTGGIHGCIKSGVYEADENYLIIDADVGSLYPSLAIKNNFYIEHLGLKFSQVYANIINLRMKAKKEGNTTLSDGFKLAANSVYGKSNDENSFLYDPKFTMCITLNGQLLLSLLVENILLEISDITVLQINTDGVTVKIHKDQVALYYSICEMWENLTKLTLEYVEYSKMVIGDVNNYLAVTTKGKVKNKGRFEVDKVVGSEPAYHKDNSFKIVPYALQEFFTKGIPVETTIRNHKVILDFCGRQKFTRESHGETTGISYDQLGNPYNRIEKQQKNVRYYIRNRGRTFVKRYSKGSTEVINKGFKVEIFNKVVEKEMKDYDVDYFFYIKECNKEILKIYNNFQNAMF